VTRTRPVVVYALVALVGAAAFLYPFWVPAHALPTQAHSVDAPLWAALVGGLVVAAVMLEVRRGTMNGATVAILGVLSAASGLLRLVDLPGNNAGIFFLVVLAGAAFGPRFGLLLGIRCWPWARWEPEPERSTRSHAASGCAARCWPSPRTAGSGGSSTAPS
jgi:hypothetical protein